MKARYLLPALALPGGFAAFLLRLIQNQTGFESSTGLAIPGHFSGLALLAFLAALCVLFAAISGMLPAEPAPVFPFSTDHRIMLVFPIAGALLLALAGGADLMEAFGTKTTAEYLEMMVINRMSPAERTFSTVETILSGVLTLLAAGSVFLAAAACRRREWRERRKNRGMFRREVLLLPVVAMVVRLLAAYRRDSVDPVYARCLPGLAALMVLTMGFYQLSSCAFRDGSTRKFTCWTLWACLFSMTAAADGVTEMTSGPLALLGGSLSLLGFLLLSIGAEVPTEPPRRI